MDYKAYRKGFTVTITGSGTRWCRCMFCRWFEQATV